MGIAIKLQETVNNVVVQTQIYDILVGNTLKVGLPSSGVDRYQSTPPASPTAAGTKGSYAVDDDYQYICIASNSWKRVPILKDSW